MQTHTRVGSPVTPSPFISSVEIEFCVCYCANKIKTPNRTERRSIWRTLWNWEQDVLAAFGGERQIQRKKDTKTGHSRTPSVSSDWILRFVCHVVRRRAAASSSRFHNHNRNHNSVCLYEKIWDSSSLPADYKMYIKKLKISWGVSAMWRSKITIPVKAVIIGSKRRQFCAKHSARDVHCALCVARSILQCVCSANNGNMYTVCSWLSVCLSRCTYNVNKNRPTIMRFSFTTQ